MHIVFTYTFHQQGIVLQPLNVYSNNNSPKMQLLSSCTHILMQTSMLPYNIGTIWSHYRKHHWFSHCKNNKIISNIHIHPHQTSLNQGQLEKIN